MVASPVSSFCQWRTLAIKTVEFIGGDPDMKVTIDIDEFREYYKLQIKVINDDPKRLMRYLKIKIDKTLLEGFEIVGYDPSPKKQVSWGPLHFTVKYKKLIQLMPGESTTLEIHLRPKERGIFKGEISVHALRGYWGRYTPVVYSIALETSGNNKM